MDLRHTKKILFFTAIFLILFANLLAVNVAFLDQKPDEIQGGLPLTAAGDPSLIFYEDWSHTVYGPRAPTGWDSNNASNLRFYALPDGDNVFTTDCLNLNDDLAGLYTWGNKSFASSVTTGTFEFEFMMARCDPGYGSATKEYHVILRDATGATNIITWSIIYTDATQGVAVTLQGTAGSMNYLTDHVYGVKIVFNNNLLDMYVDGSLELSGVSYGGQTIYQVYLETTSAMHGGGLHFDNLEVRSLSAVPEPMLTDISPAIDSDATIDLDWSVVDLATYKVYRDTKPIYNVTILNAIASPSSNSYQDTVPGQGTFWYAIVATNASGDSAPSVSKSVRVDFGMPAPSFAPPILAGISPNPDYDGKIDLNWQVNGWPQVYNATDQFTGGTIAPWENLYGYLSTSATVVQNIGSFSKAMKIVDNNNTKMIVLRRVFTAQATGSVEFWIYPTRTDRKLYIGLYDSATALGPYLQFQNDGNLYVWSGSSTRSAPLGAYASHSSYRVRIDYSSSTDRASYYINGALIANNIPFYSAAGNIDRIYIYTFDPEIGQEAYVSYFGYTGTGSYNLGDNANSRPAVVNYDVYKNATEILTIGGLSPIATLAVNQYTDIVTANGTYWYAIVANNGTNALLSNSEEVLVEISIPTASFDASALKVYINDVIQFNDTSVGGNPPLSYEWDFGDLSSNETTQNASHAYSSAGVFTVTLKVSDIDLDTSYFSRDIEVVLDTTPVASFIADDPSVFIGQSIQFNDTTVGGNAPLRYQWNFGDGTGNVTTQNVSHQFNVAGVFTVVLTVNDTDGDFSVYSMEVTVTPDIYQNGQIFTLDPGMHQVSILEGMKILMEFSINVISTIEMKVTVTTGNPTSVDLLHGLRFFKIDVLGGTYAESVLVKFHYGETGMTDAQENALSAYYLGPTTWQNIGGLVYKSENCVLVTLNHFSTYAVAWTDTGLNLPEMMVWIIALAAAILIIFGIFKLRSGKGGSGQSPDTFEDLFDEFD